MSAMEVAADPRQRNDASAARLIDIAQGTLQELRQHTHDGLELTLDSRLDDDLGLDSLARVELFTRIERAFQVTLPQTVFVEAVTLRDIWQALKTAAPTLSGRTSIPTAVRRQTLTSAPPSTLTTLDAVLAWHAEQHPNFTQITVCEANGEEVPITYRELWQGARVIAAGLQREGVHAGAAVALMLPTGADYFVTFAGVLLAGATPVPLYPPARPNQIEEHLRRHAGILCNCAAVLLVTEPALRRVAGVLRLHAPDLRKVVTVADLAHAPGELVPVTTSARDAALLQYTSGSTGQPKGVVLSHANLLANIRALGVALRIVNTDVFVSWLPLYHDMGLIGAWLGTLYFGLPLIVMSPLTFLRRPRVWLEAIHRFGGTLTAAPNFAYELCLKRIADEDLAELDLSRWRLALNGAEAVMPDTLTRFQARFSRCGLRAEVLTPVYGLAECSVGLAVPPLGRGPRIDVIERERFVRDGVAVPANGAVAHPLRFVACGIPLPGHAVRILDAAGHEVEERVEGRLEFSGPSATAGYLHDAVATSKLVHGTWLDSGDRAYIADGEIFITGRSKDIIIRAGRNLYPEELESAVGEIAGVRKGCVAVFGSTDATRGTERLVVLAETVLEAPEEREALRQTIRDRTLDLLGEPPDEIELALPHTVLKTSSGKIRRAANRALYESGNLASKTPPPLWRQLSSLWLEALGVRIRRAWRRAVELGYAGYFWGVFAVIVLGLVPLVLLPLKPTTCWRWTRAAARRFIRWARIPFTVTGEALPLAHNAIFVANHASYLDGLFLIALLPTPASFVAKRELAGVVLLGRFLERLGAQFVERFDKLESVAGAEQLAALAGHDQSCIVFPEGTFTRAPGLQSFRLGAFASAVHANVTVVPIALRGMRSLLRDGQWLPHRSPIAAHVGAALALPTTGDEFAKTVALRDAARRSILEHCGEPDLCA